MKNNSSHSLIGHSLIGLMADQHPRLLIGMLGILKSGSGFVPIDPNHPIERINFIISDCRIRVLVTDEKHLAKALEISRESSSLKHIICLDKVQTETTNPDELKVYDCDNYAAEELVRKKKVVEPDQLAYVIYTSGSTGAPKGVPITHRNLSPLLCWSREYFNFGEHTKVLQNLNYCFDFGVFELLTTLLFGGTLHFLEKDELSDFSEYAGYINGHGINTIHSTPSFFRNLLPFSDRLESLEALHLGGELLTEKAVDDIFNKVGTNCVLYNGYGPTEASINCSIFKVGNRLSWGERAFNNIPIGKASANNLLYILNKNCEPVPIGATGELYVGGNGLSCGYLNRADLTAERFIPNPFSDEPGARLYRTGDLARYLPDGNIEFLGRSDYQVKVRGLRIELGEIEAVLHQHPAIREAVVLALEDAPGNKRLVVYLVSHQETVPTISELRSFLERKLPAYMVPVAYVWMEALPLTSNGKLDRSALPAPEQSRSELATTFVAPRTRKEQTLAAIWGQVLGLEQVGVDDSFFELGGDSMRIIHIVARARQAGLAITPAQVFQHPTIAGLAEVAGTGQAAQAEQDSIIGPVSLTPIQHFFFERQLVDPHHWNWAFLRQVPQGLDPALLAKTIRHVLTHHDALRLRFQQTESGWEQVNAESDEMVPFAVIDLSELAMESQKEAIELAATALQSSLNLSEGPLLRVAYFVLGGYGADRVQLIFHHLIVDVISTRILMEDFQTTYLQLGRGETVQLPAKTTSFQAWSRRLAEYAQSAELRRELAYWIEAVSGEVPALPLDNPAGDNNEVSAELVVTVLGEEVTKALLQEIPAAAGAQMQEVLLTVLARAWERWTGQPRLLVEVEGHGREDILEGVDMSRTVGWFTTIYPVLLDISKAEGPGEALKIVQTQLRGIPQRGIGYGLLRYLCQDEGVRKQMTSLPRAEVNFNYLGQLDQPVAEATLFRGAEENKGPERSLRGRRSYPLYVVGSVRGGVLKMHWNYSGNLHERATIEHLASSFNEELRSLIAHWLSRDAIGVS
ncbi:MAG: amino acid adenylation domain-containing protein [Acidobacteria bacterium]|nr:amino acid adenylation domain-containing protein [Acidobacteriota bacterium]